MSRIPKLIIVTNRGHLIAYRTAETQSLEKIARESFTEGNEKISDIVTDQSGAFPMTGTAGTSSYESLPLVAELEVRSFRKISRKISEIIKSEHATSWGFATPSEINGAILEGLEKDDLDKLAFNLKVDITNSPPGEVYSRFERAAGQA